MSVKDLISKKENIQSQKNQKRASYLLQYFTSAFHQEGDHPVLIHLLFQHTTLCRTGAMKPASKMEPSTPSSQAGEATANCAPQLELKYQKAGPAENNQGL